MASEPAGRAESTPFAIVLSTFNGAAWLEAQVDSIRAQTASAWRLYVRDDGSRDGTARRLEELAAVDPRIEALAGDGRNLGPAASFGLLLQHALDRGERYVFLCDQDDVWSPGKCARLLAALTAREAVVGEATPLLAHSDLAVVDETLAPIHPSFVAQHRIDRAEEGRAIRLLSGNSVTGCAALVNAALLRCALPMPRVAMHDWWLAQCAGAFGEVVYVDEPLVLYRQHGRNVVGAVGLAGRAANMLRSPRRWWRASARRFLMGLHQVWVIRSRARARGLRVQPRVNESVEVLWDGLGSARATLRSRLAAAARSGVLPPTLPMRGLFLARTALLPWLRSRLGDEREGVGPETGAGARGAAT